MSDDEHFKPLLEALSLEQKEEVRRLSELRSGVPLGEQEAMGLTFLDLEVTDESVGLGGRVTLSLEKPGRARLLAPPSPGDLVEVRPRHADVAPVPATVLGASQRALTLVFERVPPEHVTEGRLRVDLVHSDVTNQRARRAIEVLQGAERGDLKRKRELLTGRAAPSSESAASALPSSEAAPSALNPEQAEAVVRALQASDFFLVHGPPGTGKSTVLATIARRAVDAGQRLLCTAASNAAVDHLLELCVAQGLSVVRLGHPARVLPHLTAHTLDVRVEHHPDRRLSRALFDEALELMGYARRQRTQGRSRQRFANARASAASARALFDEARELERRAVRAVLDEADAVCATCSTLESGLLAQRSFDLALLDEATQAIEPLALWAFLKARRVVLAGDPEQLPPTVLSSGALELGLGVSLFERLLKLHGPSPYVLLREQYRMHAAIMAFPSEASYGGALRAHETAATRDLAPLLARPIADAAPVLFIDTAGKGYEERVDSAGQSTSNPEEAELVTRRARELLAAGLSASDLGIITPYRAQASLLRDALGDDRLEIDTVDAFQGREKEAILVSMTRSNLDGSIGFLDDTRRMNVALTRARRHLFIAGDSATLARHRYYERLIASIQERGGYRSAWEWPDAP